MTRGTTPPDEHLTERSACARERRDWSPRRERKASRPQTTANRPEGHPTVRRGARYYGSGAHYAPGGLQEESEHGAQVEVIVTVRDHGGGRGRRGRYWPIAGSAGMGESGVPSKPRSVARSPRRGRGPLARRCAGASSEAESPHDRAPQRRRHHRLRHHRRGHAVFVMPLKGEARRAAESPPPSIVEPGWMRVCRRSRRCTTRAVHRDLPANVFSRRTPTALPSRLRSSWRGGRRGAGLTAMAPRSARRATWRLSSSSRPATSMRAPMRGARARSYEEARGSRALRERRLQ